MDTWSKVRILSMDPVAEGGSHAPRSPWQAPAWLSLILAPVTVDLTAAVDHCTSRQGGP